MCADTSDEGRRPSLSRFIFIYSEIIHVHADNAVRKV